MIDITIGAADFAVLKADLLADDVERCAILYASQFTRADGRTRLLVREIDLPSSDDYMCQRSDEAVLRPAYVARITKRANRENLSLVFVHSHPGASSPHFSITDDDGERHLAAFLATRQPANVHAALVVSRGGIRARQLGTGKEIRVVALGEYRTILFEPDGVPDAALETFDRQVRAFGVSGQRKLATLRVAIVGLGGTGSIIAQQLAHLGIQDFILIDPDVIEITNLNRVVGAVSTDIGRAKVDVAARYIEGFSLDANVMRLKGDVIRAQVAKAITDADVVFGCTDSHGSRSVLQQVAYQYLIPCIDMGSTITTETGSITGVFGRVQLLAPGFACLSCSGLLHPEEVRRDMMSAFEKKQDPYILGDREPAPAVISLNATVASLAMTMFMAYVTGIPSTARYILYNAINSTLHSVRSVSVTNCYICSHAGTLARGDSVLLFARQD
jgi:molybdopterin/thiamine biosynthesis adenylyltransferase